MWRFLLGPSLPLDLNWVVKCKNHVVSFASLRLLYLFSLRPLSVFSVQIQHNQRFRPTGLTAAGVGVERYTYGQGQTHAKPSGFDAVGTHTEDGTLSEKPPRIHFCAVLLLTCTTCFFLMHLSTQPQKRAGTTGNRLATATDHMNASQGTSCKR